MLFRSTPSAAPPSQEELAASQLASLCAELAAVLGSQDQWAVMSPSPTMSLETTGDSCTCMAFQATLPCLLTLLTGAHSLCSCDSATSSYFVLSGFPGFPVVGNRPVGQQGTASWYLQSPLNLERG